MAETANNPLPVEDEEQFQEETLSERFMDWVRTELVWYAGSFSFHLLALSLLLLLPNFGGGNDRATRRFWSRKPMKKMEKRNPRNSIKFDIGEIEDTPACGVECRSHAAKSPPSEARERNTTTTARSSSTRAAARLDGMKDAGVQRRGAMAFGPGPKLAGAMGIGMGRGHGQGLGSGGSGSGFGGRGSGSRKGHVAHGGGTKHTERAVTAALVWLANHQLYDGQLEPATLPRSSCTDKTCTGTGERLGRCRRDGDGPAALPRRRANAQVQRPLQGAYPQRHRLAHRAISSPTATWPRVRHR